VVLRRCIQKIRRKHSPGDAVAGDIEVATRLWTRAVLNIISTACRWRARVGQTRIVAADIFVRRDASQLLRIDRQISRSTAEAAHRVRCGADRLPRAQSGKGASAATWPDRDFQKATIAVETTGARAKVQFNGKYAGAYGNA